MKSYQIEGCLKVRAPGAGGTGPFRIGAPEQFYAYKDRQVLRNGVGEPLLPATSLCGAMATAASGMLRARGSADPQSDPAFVALFGSARGSNGGQASRLIVRDASTIAAGGTQVRDRNAIDRGRGSAANKRLFKEEVVDDAWSFPLSMEFTETGPRTPPEEKLSKRGMDPDRSALGLLLDTLLFLERGWLTLGGGGGVGYGRVRLTSCRIQERDRTSPDEILAFALDGWDAVGAHGASVYRSYDLVVRQSDFGG